jgi:hypothetical protein
VERCSNSPVHRNFHGERYGEPARSHPSRWLARVGKLLGVGDQRNRRLMQTEDLCNRRCSKNKRIGLAAMTASLLFTLSGGVVAQTSQTMPGNAFGGPGTIHGARAARNAELMQLMSSRRPARRTCRVVTAKQTSNAGQDSLLPARIASTTVVAAHAPKSVVAQ